MAQKIINLQADPCYSLVSYFLVFLNNIKIHTVQTLSSMPKMNKKLQISTFDREQIFSTSDVEEKTQDLFKCKPHRPYNTVSHAGKY